LYATGSLAATDKIAAHALTATVSAVQRGTDIAHTTAAETTRIHTLTHIYPLSRAGPPGLALPLQLVKGRPVLRVIGIHGASPGDIFKGVIQPSAGVLDRTLEKIPLRIPALGGHAVQKLLRLGNAVHINAPADI